MPHNKETPKQRIATVISINPNNISRKRGERNEYQGRTTFPFPRKNKGSDVIVLKRYRYTSTSQ